MIINLVTNSENELFDNDISILIDSFSFSVSENASKIYFATLFHDEIYISDNPDELANHTGKTVDKKGLFLLAMTGSCFHLSSPYKNIHALRPGTIVKKNHNRLIFRNNHSSRTTNTLDINSASQILSSRLFENHQNRSIFDIESVEYKLQLEKVSNLTKLPVKKNYILDEYYFESLPLFPFFNESLIELSMTSSNKYKDLLWLCGACDFFESASWPRIADLTGTETYLLKRSFLPEAILNKLFLPGTIRDGLSQIKNYVDISTQRKIIDYIYYSKILCYRNLFPENESPIMPYTDPNLKIIMKSLPTSLIKNNHVDYYILRCMMSEDNTFRNSIKDSKDLHKKILSENRDFLLDQTERLFTEITGKGIRPTKYSPNQLFNILLFLFYLKRNSIDISVKS